MLLLVALLFTLCNARCKLASKGIYSLEEVMNCLELVEINEEWNKNITSTMKKYLETYVYKDILKNPPKVNGHEGYFPKVDLDKRIDAINLTETDFYVQYQNLRSIIDSTYDLHLSFKLVSCDRYDYYIDRLYAVLPFKVYIENETDYYFVPDESNDQIITIPTDILNNKDSKVIDVNGMSPYDFVKAYANKHTFLKSPHGRFTYALASMSRVYLARTPLSEEELDQDIVIKYENNETVTVKYSLYYQGQPKSF